MAKKIAIDKLASEVSEILDEYADTTAEGVKKAVRKPKMRVAAYARVSTSSEEQLISLEAQKRHYEQYIKSHPGWEFAGLYFDEGITGTKMEKRAGLLSMLDACEMGEIDFIVLFCVSIIKHVV